MRRYVLATFATCLLVVGGVTALAIQGMLQHHPTTNSQTKAATTKSPVVSRQADTTPTESPIPNETTQPAQSSSAPATNNNPNHSTSDPASIWIVVNKKRALPSSFVPNDLVSVGGGQQMRSEAATAIKSLVDAASKANAPLKYISSYRSYPYQQTVYNGYVKQSGQAAADTFSARPGHSEHQTGLAVDVGNTSSKCDLDACFGSTTGGRWVAANAYKYGFIIRYESATTNLTGYQYEPWHLRYVGTWLAQKLHDHPQTLEQYFGFSPAPTY